MIPFKQIFPGDKKLVPCPSIMLMWLTVLIDFKTTIFVGSLICPTTLIYAISTRFLIVELFHNICQVEVIMS